MKCLGTPRPNQWTIPSRMKLTEEVTFNTDPISRKWCKGLLVNLSGRNVESSWGWRVGKRQIWKRVRLQMQSILYLNLEVFVILFCGRKACTLNKEAAWSTVSSRRVILHQWGYYIDKRIIQTANEALLPRSLAALTNVDCIFFSKSSIISLNSLRLGSNEGFTRNSWFST